MNQNGHTTNVTGGVTVYVKDGVSYYSHDGQRLTYYLSEKQARGRAARLGPGWNVTRKISSWVVFKEA